MNTPEADSQSIDLQINAKYILPFSRQTNEVLENHAILIHDGIITHIMPQVEVPRNLQVKSLINLDKHTVLPGMYNALCSLQAVAFHNIGLDLPLNLRLQNKISPLKPHLNEEISAICHELAIANLLKSGVTGFNSDYQPQSGKLKNSHQLDASFLINVDNQSIESTFEQQLAQYLQIRDDNKHTENLKFHLSIENFLGLTEQQLNKLSAICNELGIKLHTSLSPMSATNLGTTQQQSKLLKLLDKHAFLSPDLQLSDIYNLNRQQLSLLAKTRAEVIVCPTAQLIKENGLSPINALKNLKANIRLGTNNVLSLNLNLLKEIQLLSWLTKLEANNAQLFEAQDLLSFAVRQTLAEETESVITGCLAKGTKANLIAIETSSVIDNDCDPFSQIVYTANQLAVSHLWLNGSLKVEDYRLADIDEIYLNKQLNEWQDRFL